MSRKSQTAAFDQPGGLPACAAGGRGHAQGFRRGLRDPAASPRAGAADLCHRRHDARSTDDGMWVVPPQRALWMPAGVAHSIVMLERRHHAHALSARRRGGRHADGLPRAADLAAAARADRARDRAAAAVRRRRPGRPRRRPDHGRAAWPAVPAPAAADAARSKRSRRFARPCSTRRATSARWTNGRATINASARTLARRFQSETGLSFGAWRQQARVLEAMGRLGGGAPVTQVALDLGYDSVSAFSAMFRRAAGASPSAYRHRAVTSPCCRWGIFVSPQRLATQKP